MFKQSTSLPGRLLNTTYGVYAAVAFIFMALSAVLLVVIPGLTLNVRRMLAHKVARGFFYVAGIPMRLTGLPQLPEGPCVVVANHASYVDGIVLKALLPARFCFVIKKEVVKVPLVGLLLKRIGSEFVDRFNRNAGAVDARRLMKAADSGQALAFFPEGTFTDQPGLGKFHAGAFAIAARAGLPVVPLAIVGTRGVLPCGSFLPRLGRIEVRVLPIIQQPSDRTATGVTTVRDQARARILTALGEPDLSESDGVAALEVARKS
jgi:1-acyl-sn-glycerol-3-phosphate acyltransferase